MKRDPLEYVLNRMENAARSDDPAANGYGPARKELLEGIATLRNDNEQIKMNCFTISEVERAMKDAIKSLWDIKRRKSGATGYHDVDEYYKE
jgi:hypothetical protein